jgi:O-antigen/teichoic acid export membrane protein
MVTFEVYSLLVRFIITNLILLSAIGVHKRKRLSFDGKKFRIYPLLIFGFSGTAAAVIHMLGQNLVLKTIILIIFGQDQVGYFDFAYRLSIFINTAMVGFFASLNAYYARLYGEGGSEKLRKEGGWVVQSNLFIFAPLVIGALVVGSVMFNELFINYLPALGFFIVLTLGLLARIILMPFLSMIDAIGKPEIKLVRTAVGLSCGYVFLLLTYRVGAISIALTWVSIDTIGLLVLFGYCRLKIGRFVIKRKKSVLNLLAACIMGIPVYFVYYLLPSLLALPIMIIVGFITYLTLIREFRLVERRELQRLSNFLLPKKIVNQLEKLLIKG